MKKIFLLSGLLIGMFACRQPQTQSNLARNKFQDPVLRSIYTLQDERNTPQLLHYLKNPDPKYRHAAALAFASVQDKKAVPELNLLLADSVANVRKAAAFALGQTADAEAEAGLLSAIDQEKDRPTRAVMFEALGKVSTEKGLAVLAYFTSPDSIIQAGQAWGLYRAQLKGALPEKAYEKLVNYLQPEFSREVRLAAAQTLARSGKTDLTRYFAYIQAAMQTEKWYPVRSAEATALGKTNTPQSAEVLMLWTSLDPDYRVRVNALRTLKGQPSLFQPALFKALADPNMHVRLTAAEMLAIQKPENSELLQKLAMEQTDWRTRAILFGIALNTAKTPEPIISELKNQYSQTKNVYEKGALLQALGNNPNSYDFLVTETFGASLPVLKTYGMEALANLRKLPNFPENQKAPYAEMLKKALASSDVAMIGIAAGLIREPELNFKAVYTDLDFLEKAKAKLKLPRDVEPFLELQKTIAFLEGKPEPAPPVLSNQHPINWALVQTLNPEQLVKVKTSRGDITLKLMVEDVPGSAGNFAELVKNGFYNGRFIHRVVPNFVAQDGCPRGDGWGSTDYNIRSEFAPLRYQEGTVGMASAGKDTESCQWFITHAPTPHLEGRYSIFAQVVSGMEVAQQLQIGDKIEKMELMK